MNKLLPKKSFSFRAPRDAYKKVFSRLQPSSDAAIPGPGTYSAFSLFGKEGRRFSIHARIKNLDLIYKRTQSPGPCAYAQLLAINPKGKYMYSKYQNSLSTLINPPHSNGSSSI